MRKKRVAVVAVVGAGLAGLSAALELAERGLKVTVLEAQQVGFGASGRNGGQLIRGVGHGVEQFGHIVMRLDLGRKEVLYKTQVVFDDILCQLHPIDQGVSG